MKGFLYSRGAEDVWGHSLADLCEDAKIFEMLFDVLKVRAIYLDKYYNLTRYPNYLPGGIPADVFDDLETERALELAERGAYLRPMKGSRRSSRGACERDSVIADDALFARWGK